MEIEERDCAAHRAVHLFGGPSLICRDRPIPLSPKEGALLAALFSAGEGAGRTREEVTALLWAGSDRSRLLRRLSQLLYLLSKKSCHPPLIRNHGRALRPDPDRTSIDLNDLEAHVAAGRIVDAWSIASQGFLSNLPVAPTRKFEDWRRGKELRLRSTIREQAARQWREAEATADWATAASAAEVLLALDPSDEDVLQKVMWAQGMGGLVHEAVTIYKNFSEEQALASEGDAWGASESTLTLLRRLESLEGEEEEAAGRSGNGSRSPSFLARREELTQLSNLLNSRHGDRFSFAMISGEGGIGKTRLAEEVLRIARLKGTLVLSARCSEFGSAIPLNPILDALSPPVTRKAVETMEDPWKSVLLPHFPGSESGDAASSEGPPDQPVGSVRRLCESFEVLLASLARQHPTILFLDDFQWADEMSVVAMDFLRRRWKSGHLSILLSFRPEDLIPGSRIERFLTAMGQVERATHVKLGELDRESAEGLAKQIAGSDLSASRLDELCTRGGRNPFFLCELTSEYVSRRGQDSLTLKPGEPVPLPESIGQLLNRRLDLLNEAAASVLRILALCERPVAVPDLSDLTSLSPETTLDGLEELLNHQLIRWTDCGAIIRHGLIRQAAYERLSEVRRTVSHGKIARYLRGLPGPPRVEELALHFDRAGARDEARRYALEAVARVEAPGAVPDALGYLAIARRNASDCHDEDEIVGRLARLNYLHRDLPTAIPLLEEAAGRFRLRDRAGEALRADLHRIDALNHTSGLGTGECLSRLTSIKEKAVADDLWGIFMEALDIELHIFDEECDAGGVRQVLDQAERNIGKGSARARCSACGTLAIHIHYGSPEKALRYARKGVRISQEHDVPPELALRASNRLILVMAHLGLLNSEEAHAVIERGESVVRSRRDLVECYKLHSGLGVWNLDIGNYGAADKFFKKAHTIIEGTEATASQANLSCNLGMLRYHTGRVSSAEDEFLTAERLVTSTSVRSLRRSIKAGLGLCALHSGALGEAKRRDRSLGDPAREWFFDPSILVQFRAEMIARFEGWAKGADFLAVEADKISGRYVPTWIGLKLLEAKFRSRFDGQAASLIGEETLAVSQELGLSRRAEQALTYIKK